MPPARAENASALPTRSSSRPVADTRKPTMPTSRSAGPKSASPSPSLSMPNNAIQAIAPSMIGKRNATYPHRYSSTSAVQAPTRPPTLCSGAVTLPECDQPGSCVENVTRLASRYSSSGAIRINAMSRTSRCLRGDGGSFSALSFFRLAADACATVMFCLKWVALVVEYTTEGGGKGEFSALLEPASPSKNALPRRHPGEDREPGQQ